MFTNVNWLKMLVREIINHMTAKRANCGFWKEVILIILLLLSYFRFRFISTERQQFKQNSDMSTPHGEFQLLSSNKPVVSTVLTRL
jgi:hypothetical protein